MPCAMGPVVLPSGGPYKVLHLLGLYGVVRLGGVFAGGWADGEGRLCRAAGQY